MVIIDLIVLLFGNFLENLGFLGLMVNCVEEWRWLIRFSGFLLLIVKWIVVGFMLFLCNVCLESLECVVRVG